MVDHLTGGPIPIGGGGRGSGAGCIILYRGGAAHARTHRKPRVIQLSFHGRRRHHLHAVRQLHGGALSTRNRNRNNTKTETETETETETDNDIVKIELVVRSLVGMHN